MPYGSSYDETWLAQQLQKPGYGLVPGAAPVEATPCPPETSEATLLARVRLLARQHGYLVYHTYRSDKSEPGYPDCTLVRPGRLIFAELKSRTGKLTMEQQQWLDMLRHAIPGVEVYVWRPHDLDMIPDILTRKEDL